MITTRYSQKTLELKLSRALREAAGDRVLQDVDAAVGAVIEAENSAIRASGRGGAHNSDFASQDVRVTRSASGRINIQAGWLNPSAHARERGGGGRLWYQYQDSGFRLFGGPNWIEGVGATIDRRENVLMAVEGALHRHVRRVARELR